MAYYFFNYNAPLFMDGEAANPSMLDYFKKFDPIGLKYGIEQTKSLSVASRATASCHERMQQYGYITKQEYSFMMENLKLVYGVSNPEVQADIEMYQLVEKQIIFLYLGIPQLNKMFDEDYFNFEWDMHVGQNFREHRNAYYRDHFIHQIRNLYMMLILLDKFDFYETTHHIFRQKNASKISEFVYKKWWNFKEDETSPQIAILKKICRESDYQDERKYIDDFFYKYVIYASSMLAALFHDMGYPICHFLGVRHRTSDYNPTMYMFTHNAVESFDMLSSKLSSSLLFTIVSSHEIKQRLDISKSGKYDHGAYSAIAFLLQFYETGLIFSLTSEKQCAIELAAVAIYNHTGKYKSLSGTVNTNYYTIFFRQNPISFLLRFCDDLQEWDRRYFEISDASDLMFCRKCGFPLIRYPKTDNKVDNNIKTDETGKADKTGKMSKTNISEYRCGCFDSGSVARPDIFEKRKLYLVTVADWVSFHIKDADSELIAKIDYNPYKLLMLAKINRTYAKNRLKELSEVKRFLYHQNFALMSDNCLGFSNIRLDYFMSANPLLIKLKILENFVRCIDWSNTEVKRRSTVLTDLETISLLNGLNTEEARGELVRKIFVSSIDEVSNAPEKLRDFLITQNALDFYIHLLSYCIARNIDGYQPAIPFYENFITPFYTIAPQYYKVMKVLTADCIDQFEKDYLTMHQVEITRSSEGKLEELTTQKVRLREKRTALDNSFEQKKKIFQIATSDKERIIAMNDLINCQKERDQIDKQLHKIEEEYNYEETVIANAAEAYILKSSPSIPDNALYHQIGVYTDSHNYFNHYDAVSGIPIPYIGYYKDIGLFYEMNEKTRRV